MTAAERAAMDKEARLSVLGQLSYAYERWAEKEQELVGQGDYVEAEGAHIVALRVLRAYTAEDRNDPPAFVP